jgi:hypothetical protein
MKVIAEVKKRSGNVILDQQNRVLPEADYTLTCSLSQDSDLLVKNFNLGLE